jgi:hypothetical protein
MLAYGAGNPGLFQGSSFAGNELTGAFSTTSRHGQASKMMAGGTGPNDDFDGDGGNQHR